MKTDKYYYGMWFSFILFYLTKSDYVSIAFCIIGLIYCFMDYKVNKND